MVLIVTDPARDKILELRAQEDEPDRLGLRIEVTGVQGVEYTYDLTFDPVADADPAVGDLVETQGDLPVIVPVDSIDALRGATLDLPLTNGQQGLVLRNPNRPDPLSGAHIELSGTVEDKVRQLLDGQINPSLAMHGGFAALERVEDDTVYVTMGGGCQGCGMASVTLTQGIKELIREAAPEIVDVEDVTDHAAGTNPYYEPE